MGWGLAQVLSSDTEVPMPQGPDGGALISVPSTHVEDLLPKAPGPAVPGRHGDPV